MTGPQSAKRDDRNENCWMSIDGELVRKGEARVSAFDAGFVLGDGVWEGVRVIEGRIPLLERHFDRLEQGARFIGLRLVKGRDDLYDELVRLLQANEMDHGVHVRMMVTRGVKSEPNQDPRLTGSDPTVVISAEHRIPNPVNLADGIRLQTSPFRSSGPDVFEMRLNSHSRLNLIQSLQYAARVGADEAVMLDPHGFVSSCNSTNLFWIKGRTVHTSVPRYCFNGITRQTVIESLRDSGWTVVEHDYSLFDLYSADEVFVTGTFPGVMPVQSVDVLTIGSGKPGPVTQEIRDHYQHYLRTTDEATTLPALTGARS